MGEIIGGLAFAWAMCAIVAGFGWGMWFDETYGYGNRPDGWAKDIYARHVVALAVLTAPVAVVVGASICLFLAVKMSTKVIREATTPIASALVTSIEKRIS